MPKCTKYSYIIFLQHEEADEDGDSDGDDNECGPMIDDWNTFYTFRYL